MIYTYICLYIYIYIYNLLLLLLLAVLRGLQDFSSPTRGRPWQGKSPNHWTAREFPHLPYLSLTSFINLTSIYLLSPTMVQHRDTVVNKTRLRTTFAKFTDGKGKEVTSNPQTHTNFGCPKSRGKHVVLPESTVGISHSEAAWTAEGRVGVTKVKARGLGEQRTRKPVAERNKLAKGLQSQNV